jgi:hypothetical protein
MRAAGWAARILGVHLREQVQVVAHVRAPKRPAAVESSEHPLPLAGK